MFDITLESNSSFLRGRAQNLVCFRYGQGQCLKGLCIFGNKYATKSVFCQDGLGAVAGT